MKQIKTQNYWEGRGGEPILAIVLHITDSTETSAINTFQNSTSCVSTHYLVGEIQNYQFVDEKDAAWHCGLVRRPTTKSPALQEGVNPNLTTIGVEVTSVGIFPKISQWFRWAKLIKEIAERNNIPISETGIINHNEIRFDKLCPGHWFNRSWLKLLINFV